MQFGFLGYGSIARAHALALSELRQTAIGRDVRFRAVMGRLPGPTREFAAEHGFERATTDLDELLADERLDAVVICSPTDAHAEQTRRALEAGKHVLCEIPLATSLGDVDGLIALADRVDRRLMVCHTQRYFPAIAAAHDQVGSGAVHVHSATCRYMFHRRENINWMGRRRSWTDNLIWHHGCHAIDAALWVLGAEAADATAKVALPDDRLGIPLDLSFVMRTPRDQVVTVAMSYNTHIAVHDYLFVGEENTLLFADNQLRDRDGIVVADAPDSGPDAPITRQDGEFLAAVREGREPAVSARSVRPAMTVLQVAQDELDRRLAEAGMDARHPRMP